MENTAFQPLLRKLLRDAYMLQQSWLRSLSREEQEAIGSPERWAARDHIANLTFWRIRLTQQLEMLRRGEQPPAYPSAAEANAAVFQQNVLRPLEVIVYEAAQSQEKLLVQLERFSEEELSTLHQDWMDGNDVLGMAIMDIGYTSPLRHLVRYYLDHDNLAQATRMQELLTEQLLGTSVPDSTKGIGLYNLACFYARHNLVDKVLDRLLEALHFYPYLKEWALNDPDLAPVRHWIG